ncbi:IclR family transcriptional regulator [Streptomyces sp. NPDC054904]|uniref:IclR family transcriptional regulator n=1 Tax=unclassified Streptomyces TaxID=2593676 RepID=UPI002481B5D5|nr:MULTISPECIES: IclR family transcriptional regulator [unclassified Streptomyces]MDA5282132.1 IclR family transcriptional regulator [Streptomyces sp. Isolate_45]MDX2396038.1 IclR family transcriptional regulator [Streptomyces sp. DK15]
MLDQVMESGLAPLSLLEKAAKVLGAFEGPQPRLSLTEVVRRSGIPRSSAHRILDQLVRLRWLDREGRDYRMGMRMLELGALAAHHNRLRRAALPLLHALHEQTGQLVHLWVLDGAEVVCLERIGGSEAGAVPSRVGGRMPACSTAAGKAMLAFGDQDTVEEVLARGLRPRTARTLVRPAALRAELAATRERGVAHDREETFRGVHCVAAPLRGAGRAVAAVSLSSCRGERELARQAPAVLACARSVWRELYGPGRAGRAAASVPPVAAEPAVSAREMDNMMGWLRFSEWM